MITIITRSSERISNPMRYTDLTVSVNKKNCFYEHVLCIHVLCMSNHPLSIIAFSKQFPISFDGFSNKFSIFLTQFGAFTNKFRERKVLIYFARLIYTMYIYFCILYILCEAYDNLRRSELQKNFPVPKIPSEIKREKNIFRKCEYKIFFRTFSTEQIDAKKRRLQTVNCLHRKRHICTGFG